MIPDLEEMIRQRAHEIWEQEGRPHGRHADHWHQASQAVGDELFQQQGATDGQDRRSALDGALLPEGGLVAAGGPAGAGLAGLGVTDAPADDDGSGQQQG